MDKAVKEQVKIIKDEIKNESGFNELKLFMEGRFNRISDRKDKNYDEIYNLVEIFKANTIKEVSHKYKNGESALIEFINYEKAPNGLVIIINGFEKGCAFQKEIAIYIIK